jgi:hypothetical protein
MLQPLSYRLRALLGYISLLTVTAGCTPGPLFNSIQPTPDPAFAVTIDALMMEPARYANTFLVIQNVYSEPIARPACSPWIGPPITWAMSNGQRSIEIKSAFPDGAQPNIDDHFYERPQITLHGWLRRYDGPIGCVAFDQQGRSLLDQMEQQQVWYFEAVQLESSAPITWRRPQDPTKTPRPPQATVTPQP